MAGTHGHAPTDLKQELLESGHHFSFHQALRLLALMEGSPSAAVQIRPELTFGFPKADVSRIDALADGGYQLTATFLGLYGTASPLPSFYTEDLFKDRRHDSSAVRDFLDIIHRQLYDLLHESWKKYQIILQIYEGKADTPLRMLYALTGVTADSGAKESDEEYELVRYSGLLGGHPRSAMALQTLLTDMLYGPAVEIISSIPRTVEIPLDQRLQLGGEDMPLGVNSVLGEELTDIQGKFRVRIGPLTQKRYRAFLEKSPEWEKLLRMVRRFLIDPLDFDFEFVLAEGEKHHPRLGSRDWSRLGLDTILFTGRYTDELRSVLEAV